MRHFGRDCGQWLSLCALLAACSRPDSPKACELGGTDKARQAELVRTAVTPSGCAGAGAIAVLDHRAELNLQLSPTMVTGSGELRVRALAPTNVVQLDSAGLRISSASARDAPLRFTQLGDATCLELSQPLAAGEELSLVLAWQALPHGASFGADQAWAGARAALWLPTRLGLAQRATLNLTLTVAEDLNFVGSRSQGLFVTRLGDGLARAQYQVTTPTSPSLYAFALGHFRTANYYSPTFMRFSLSAVGPQASDLEGILERTLPMFVFLHERTGAKPATGYAQVFIHGESAQEALGLSLIPESVLRDVRADPTDDEIIAHQLAHQWFGVLVPCADLAHLWLNEGFATFMVAAIREQRGGRAAYDREVERWRARSQELHACGYRSPLALARPGPARALEVTEAELRARGLIYYRGALVLAKLRRELGDHRFWDGIRHYVAEQSAKPTRTEDLQRAMTASSARDLQAFFDRWVYADAPDL